jgi:hypothetical protein
MDSIAIGWVRQGKYSNNYFRTDLCILLSTCVTSTLLVIRLQPTIRGLTVAVLLTTTVSYHITLLLCDTLIPAKEVTFLKDLKKKLYVNNSFTITWNTALGRVAVKALRY